MTDAAPELNTAPLFPTALDPAASRVKSAVPDSAKEQGYAAFYPNTGELIPINNDAFQGVVLCRTRTPGDPYFTGHRQNWAFELQIQGRFKQLPIGRTWLGLEVTQPTPLPMMQRMMIRGLLRVVSALGWTFHATIDSTNEDDLPHVTYPMLSSMDCVIVTPPGEPLPRLGDDFTEQGHPTAYKSLQSLPEDFVLGHCYTMCFFSQFLDFEEWCFAEIPGFGFIKLSTFWPDTSLRFVCYAASGDKHLLSERQTFISFEIAHQAVSRYTQMPDPLYSAVPDAPPSQEVSSLHHSGKPSNLEKVVGEATLEESEAGATPESNPLHLHPDDSVEPLVEGGGE
eukprot:GGOE01008901.1.p2 GENE.GGOE01008901.1~~GGOE01008901.1.p2  ORF type:complete len:366 (+),score=91.87 GGOE01008901.1:80-1099(+)